MTIRIRGGFIQLHHVWVRAAAIDVITELEVITSAGYRYGRGGNDNDDELMDAIKGGRRNETQAIQ
jgi:hypothetical protein